MIQDRLGQCTITCANTIIPPGGKYSDCTDKVGCRAPDYKNANSTINNSGKDQRCVCYEESFGNANNQGQCNCDNSTTGHDRGGNCACKAGTYV